MLRQLAKLTRPLEAAGEGALAVAVYADAADAAVQANESGFEGVACVDDAARVLDVLCDVWSATGLPWIERWVRGLLEFVLWMQEPDGRWVNFVYDWNGRRNTAGITSVAGENFWHARAVVATSNAWLTLGDDRAEAALHRGLDHMVAKPAPPDVRALHVLAANRLLAAGRAHWLATETRHWCEELLACTDGAVLKNSPYERTTPHLWAHIQEGVLADAATLLDEPGWVDVASASARALIVPTVEKAFPESGFSPYDVASCVHDLERLHRATGDATWDSLARDARAWFDGRNPAERPVYDRDRGRVADGVDNSRVSENSGAESNVVAAQALFDDAVACAVAMEPAF
jgi:hypothetical protein